MDPGVQSTIHLRRFNVAYLREILKRLGKSCSYMNKSQMLMQIEDLLKFDKDRTTKVVVDVWRCHYGDVPSTGGTSSTSASSYGAGHDREHYDPTSLFAPVPAPTPVTPSALAKRILDYDKVQQLELATRQGLLESCRVIGATIIDHKHPRTNKFFSSPLTSEELEGLGKQYRLTVRFMLYDPAISGHFGGPVLDKGLATMGPWKFCRIWPKEGKLVLNSSTVFDTFPKNRLGMTAVGFKEPTPSVDVSDIFCTQRRNAASSSFDSSPIHFEYSVPLNASHMKWIVVATVLKKKMREKILSDMLQRSPTPTQCTQRVVRYFNEEEDLGITDVEVSLKDPASLAPMKIAVRGLDCLHLQCFDLFTFLEINESSRQPSWKCPLCAKNAEVSFLVTDTWFQGIIDAKAKEIGKSMSKAKVHPDGTWTLVEDEPDDDYDDEDSDQEQEFRKRQKTESPAAQAPAPSPPVPKAGTSRADAIELLDDDDILF